MINCKGVSTEFLELPGLPCLTKEMRYYLEAKTRNSSVTLHKEVMKIMKRIGAAVATSVSINKPKIFYICFPAFGVAVESVKHHLMGNSKHYKAHQ